MNTIEKILNHLIINKTQWEKKKNRTSLYLNYGTATALILGLMIEIDNTKMMTIIQAIIIGIIGYIGYNKKE